MSTEYELVELLDGSVLSVIEQSSRFDICAFGNANEQILFEGLRPEELERIAFHLLMIASYNGGTMFDDLELEYPRESVVVKKP